MRFLTASVTALALTAFAGPSALACEWMKSAKAKPEMSVAQTAETSQISIATNDLGQEIIDAETPAIKPLKK